MILNEIEAAIEALLFAAGEEIGLSDIALSVGQDEKTARALIRSLADKYDEEKRGIEITEVNGTYRLRTRPEFYGYITALFKAPQRRPMSQTLLETLAIIAYRQPITKPQIEDIRGVNADHAVNRLMELGLICEKGRLDVPGKPILFVTTNDFLRHYGFENLGRLPELPEETEELRNEAEGEVVVTT